MTLSGMAFLRCAEAWDGVRIVRSVLGGELSGGVDWAERRLGRESEADVWSRRESRERRALRDRGSPALIRPAWQIRTRGPARAAISG